jgi:hypothetical protein
VTALAEGTTDSHVPARDPELERELSRVLERVARKVRLRDLHAAMWERREREYAEAPWAFGV